MRPESMNDLLQRSAHARLVLLTALCLAALAITAEVHRHSLDGATGPPRGVRRRPRDVCRRGGIRVVATAFFRIALSLAGIAFLTALSSVDAFPTGYPPIR
jgi:hypothetical protein